MSRHRATGQLLFCALLASAWVGCGFGEPSGKITADSKTRECGQELEKTLDAFSRDMGLRFSVEPGDVEHFFGSGRIEKHYARDGIQYTVYLGLEKTKKGCQVKFYKRGRREPGVSSTTSGNFGTVALDVCQCQ